MIRQTGAFILGELKTIKYVFDLKTSTFKADRREIKDKNYLSLLKDENNTDFV